jgi:flagellar biosynthetic protein FliR
MEAELTRLFQIANETTFVVAGVFTRVAAVIFLVPGLGERGLSVRLKLMAALLITLMLLPMVRSMVTLSPDNAVDLARVLVSEAVAGLVLGLSFRLLVFALQTAGMVAALHLSVAQMFGSGVAPDPEPTIATILSLGGIAIALSAGLHIAMVTALVEYYSVFPFGVFPDTSSLAEWAIAALSRTFALGVTLAAPFVAIGFAYNLALGALNRAMPQLLVALVGVPFLVWIGIVVLYLVIPGIFAEWDVHLQRTLVDPLGGLR